MSRSFLRKRNMQVHVAYQTSGCIAVHDHDALRHLKFSQRLAGMLGAKDTAFSTAAAAAQSFVADKKPGQVIYPNLKPPQSSGHVHC